MQHTYDGLIRYGLVPLTVLLAVVYISRGYRNALLLPTGSIDLSFRYNEQQYVVRGVNPISVYELLRGYSGANRVEIDQSIDLNPRGVDTRHGPTSLDCS
jgi:hypothetical protein